MKSCIKFSACLLAALILSSCSPDNMKKPDNKPVRLIFKNELGIVAADSTPECSYLGEVIGSEGHWYTYLFVSNTDLTQGAINQIYNKANDLGANVVFILSLIHISEPTRLC